MSISKKDLGQLKEAIFYMNMSELKQACINLNLSHSGMKLDRIRRILAFIEKGEVIKTKALPSISKAKKKEIYPLAPTTRILSGNYKNDLKTRLFMKKLVGPHFHFTAFGQDWMRKRWMAGDPPTYAEFAVYWQKEYESRKNKKATPKQEWAYLNFIQRYLKKHPKASRCEITEKWEEVRETKAKKAQSILDSVSG
jgi:hypothetical protein